MAQFMTGGGRRFIPGQAINVTGPGISSASTEALGRMGGFIAGEALQVQQQQTLELRQQQQERQQLFEASERQREALAVDQANDKIRDLHDELGNQLKSGQIAKDKAESQFIEQAKKITDEVVPTMRPQTQGLALQHIERTTMTLGNSMRRLVDGQARHEVTAGLQQQLENLQREYSADPAKATATAMALIEAQGPFTNLTPEQRGKLAQGWKEQTQFTAAFEAVSAGRSDRKALSAAEDMIGKLPDLDPQKRAQLMDRAQAYRLHLDQQDEMAAARRQREADAHLKRAEAAFNTYQTMADKGTLLDPAYTDQVIQLTRGTPYQQGVVAMARQAREMGGLAAQPIAAQQANLDAINAQIAQQGRSPALDKRKEQAEKVLSGSRGDLQKDPMRAGLERGVITELPPLDFSAGLPGLVQQVQARIPGQQRVSAWAGRPVSPLNSEEADNLGRMLSSLPPKDRANAVVMLQQVVGPQASQGLAAQINEKDAALGLAFGYATSQTTSNRYVSELIFLGQQAKKDGTSTKGAKQPELKASMWKARLAEELRDAYPAQDQADKVLQAAEMIAHGIAAEQHGELREADLQRTARLAAGGPIVELNGRKVAMPAGVDESSLQRRLRSISAQELGAQAPGGVVLAGGAPMAVADFIEALPGQQLVYAGPNRYAVLVGGRPVKNSQGQNITLKVN